MLFFEWEHVYHQQVNIKGQQQQQHLENIIHLEVQFPRPLSILLSVDQISVQE